MTNVIINASRKTGLLMSPIEFKSTVGESEVLQLMSVAKQHSEWAWSDVMVGFREVGYDPTINESDRIKNQLYIKKLKSLIKNKYNILLNDVEPFGR